MIASRTPQLSTYEGDDILTSVRRRHEGETNQICCPNIISSYNSSMGGVDLTDQYIYVLLFGWSKDDEVAAPCLLAHA